MNLIKVIGCLLAVTRLLCPLVNAQTRWLEPMPDTFGANDTIRIDLFAGEEGDPLVDVLQISAEISCVGCTFLLETSMATLTFSSWFANDVNWQLTADLSGNGKTLLLEATRTDGRPRSGYGYVASLDGIIIVIEEISKKEPELILKRLATRRSSGLSFQEGKLVGQGPDPGTPFRVVNSTGATVMAGSWHSAPDVGHLPAGLYWMLMGTGTGTTVFRWVQR